MAPIYAIWALSRITGHYAIWTQLTFIGILVMCCMIVFLVRYAHPRLRRRQEYTDNLSRVLRENLTGIYVIRANNAEKLQEEKFEKENTVLTVNERKAHHGMGLMRPTIQLTSNLLAAGIYVSGAYLIQQAGAAEQLTIFSEMIAFTSYTANLIQSFMNMNIALNMYPRAAVSSERILEVLSRQSTIKDPARPVSPEPLGTLAFQHVSFTYPGTHQEVLKDVSFAVEKGKTLGIIGSTGSGKTTLMNLIPRLYDVSGGTVLVDGVDVRAMSQQDLRSRIGYASQQAVLLSGTVDYNVQYGPSKQPLSTKEALDIAQASEFVDSMPGGQQAEVARGGANLSGGQKQRLSIARAVRRHPEFYLFDDTFSALDYKTDRALRTALRKQTAGVTTILVSQRIETIRDADEILVLDQGQIAGRGSHAELLRSCPVYREIARTQLPEEEVSGDGEGSL
jgi:ATP-binding cassette subfamily B protein